MVESAVAVPVRAVESSLLPDSVELEEPTTTFALAIAASLRPWSIRISAPPIVIVIAHDCAQQR